MVNQLVTEQLSYTEADIGLDVDWEYPKDETEAQNLVDLLKETRAVSRLILPWENVGPNGYQALDTYTSDGGGQMLLSVACPAGPQNYEKMNLKAMDMYLDFWNLMAYDYAGSWDVKTGHQSNLYPSKSDPSSTPFSTAKAIEYYRNQGISPSKIVLGMPLYGRAFASTIGVGQPFTGTGEGSWEQGVWDFKALPQPGAEEIVDEKIGASWSYDDKKKLMVSYDTTELAKQKAEYIMEEKLGGAMWWESSADKKGEESLIGTVSR